MLPAISTTCITAAADVAVSCVEPQSNLESVRGRESRDDALGSLNTLDRLSHFLSRHRLRSPGVSHAGQTACASCARIATTDCCRLRTASNITAALRLIASRVISRGRGGTLAHFFLRMSGLLCTPYHPLKAKCGLPNFCL